MLKSRVITGILIGLCMIGILFVPAFVLNIIVGLIGIMAIKEMIYAIKCDSIKYTPISVVLYLSTIYLFFTRGLNSVVDYKFFLAYIFGLFVALLFIMVFSNNKINFTDVSLNLFSILYIVGFLSFVLFTRYLDIGINGSIYILLIFISAWATDIGAYTIGMTLGKHKIPSKISPKKSIEGVFGGIFFCTIVNILYCIVLNKYFNFMFPIWYFIIFGIVVSIISQLGDFVASAIKRTVEIKDFSDLMPGHGGVIDRFDSVLLVAPTVYIFISLII